MTCLAFAPAEAGGGLASGSVDGTIALWRRVHGHGRDGLDATTSDARNDSSRLVPAAARTCTPIPVVHSPSPRRPPPP